jgi:hypothetical protein
LVCFYEIKVGCHNDDDYHVDRVRLRLWTVVTSRPLVHALGDIWAWRTIVDWNRQRKVPDSSIRALWQSYRQGRLVARDEGNDEFGHAKYFCSNLWFLHAVKPYDMGPPTLIPLRRKGSWAFLSPLKIHRLGWVWNSEPWVQWQAR